MSETPIRSMSEYQGRLTDEQIENRVTEAEKRGDFDLWEQESPPTYLMPEQNHEVVAPVREEVVAEQPSVIEVHNGMTQQEKIAYVGAITPVIPKVRSEYALIA